MKIKVTLPPMLQQLTGSGETVEVEGTTIRECLDDFKKQFPDAQGWLDENGPVAWVTLNQKIVGMNELDQKVSEGDYLRFILLLSGG